MSNCAKFGRFPAIRSWDQFSRRNKEYGLRNGQFFVQLCRKPMQLINFGGLFYQLHMEFFTQFSPVDSFQIFFYFFFTQVQTPVTLCSGELWSILVVRPAHSADLRSRLRHVSSAPSVAYSTGCSWVVTHPGTNPARRCLTSDCTLWRNQYCRQGCLSTPIRHFRQKCNFDPTVTVMPYEDPAWTMWTWPSISETWLGTWNERIHSSSNATVGRAGNSSLEVLMLTMKATEGNDFTSAVVGDLSSQFAQF